MQAMQLSWTIDSSNSPSSKPNLLAHHRGSKLLQHHETAVKRNFACKDVLQPQRLRPNIKFADNVALSNSTSLNQICPCPLSLQQQLVIL